METISISNLKAHLSATLKKVMKGGHIIVMDREHPVAELKPYSDKPRLMIREAESSKKKVKNHFHRELELDPVDLLLEDRSGKRF